MVWNVVASVGLGLLGARSSRKATSAATSAAGQALEAEQSALDFQKEQYQDWKNIFGDVQENLAEYYNGLSPDRLAVRDLEAFEQERERALTTVRQTFAQRGIGTSGLASQAEADIAIASAEERGRIRADAPDKAAQQRLSFLTLGMGQNPAGAMSAALNNTASRRTSTATAAAEASGVTRAASTEQVGKAVTSVADYLSTTDLFKGNNQGAEG